MADDDMPAWKSEHVRTLLNASEAAKKSHEEWQRRWFLSLAFGNAAGIAAVASAAFNVAAAVGSDPAKRHLFEALVPAAWLFAAGLVTGGLLPFLWSKKVELVPDLNWYRRVEYENNGPQTLGDPSDDGVFTEDEISRCEAHIQRWTRLFNVCERISTGAFLISLLWLLVLGSAWVWLGP